MVKKYMTEEVEVIEFVECGCGILKPRHNPIVLQDASDE